MYSMQNTANSNDTKFKETINYWPQINNCAAKYDVGIAFFW